jgi:hypothetical protein
MDLPPENKASEIRRRVEQLREGERQIAQKRDAARKRAE